MKNKWMMNWWMDDGFILNGIFQWEKFLNVCVFQWHFWLIFLVEIHSMCVFSIFDGRFLMVDSFNGDFQW